METQKTLLVRNKFTREIMTATVQVRDIAGKPHLMYELSDGKVYSAKYFWDNFSPIDDNIDFVDENAT